METFKDYTRAVLAGFAIGIGCTVYLTVGGVAGAVLFGFGLLTVVHYQLKLYTGTAGFIQDASDMVDLIKILVCNAFGIIAAVMISSDNETLISTSQVIVEKRLNTGALRCGLLAVGCGFIMTTAVEFARKEKFLPLLFGVPVFILCGFTHCVADMFYYYEVAYHNPCFNAEHHTCIIGTWIATVVGNFIGCNIPRLIR